MVNKGCLCQLIPGDELNVVFLFLIWGLLNGRPLQIKISFTKGEYMPCL